MCNCLKPFLKRKRHGILFQSQYGFHEKRPTQHALLEVVNTIQNHLNSEPFSCEIFRDFKKAFDTVDNSILLLKLEFYGIRGPVLHERVVQRNVSTQCIKLCFNLSWYTKLVSLEGALIWRP